MSHAHPTLPAQTIACHECDLLQTEPELAPGQTARCVRCGAFLARNPPDSLDRTLALTLTAAILADGGFKDTNGPVTPDELTYVRVVGRKKAGEVAVRAALSRTG